MNNLELKDSNTTYRSNAIKYLESLWFEYGKRTPDNNELEFCLKVQTGKNIKVIDDESQEIN